MPHTINGIGTWYHGKNNRHTRRGTCEFCGHFGDLASYDTTLFFVVVFIPVVPLKRMHVVDECPACHRHRALKLKEWEKLRDEALNETLSAYRAAPNDEEKAVAAIGTTLFYRVEDAFKQLAPAVRRSLPRSARALAALGEAYAFFGDKAEGEQCYRESLRIVDDPGVRHALAVLLLRVRRPEEAEALLRPAIDSSGREDVGLTYLMIEGYQATGAHDEALRLLDELARRFPGIENDKDVARYRKVSGKNRGKRRPVVSAVIADSDHRVTRGGSAVLPRLVFPALLVIAFIVYLGIAMQRGQSRKVYIVNGLERPYEVEVNGQRVSFVEGEGWLKSINLPEGEVRVKGLDPAVPLGEQTAKLSTNFWMRPFRKTTFVINPDRVAILRTEVSEYASNPKPTETSAAISGELVQEFRGMDHEFETLPSTIQAKKGSRITKRRVFQEQQPPVRATFTIARELGVEVARPHLKRVLELEPDNEEAVQLLAALFPPDEALGLLRTRLAERPVRIHWHRVYQELMETNQPKHDLEAEYAALAQREPNDPTLTYLVGRVTADRARAEELFERAAAGQPFAWYALSYARMTQGRFSEALDYARRGKGKSSEASFDSAENAALHALGRYEELLNKWRNGRDQEMHFARANSEAFYLACLGRPAQAGEVIERFLDHIDDTADSETVGRLRALLESTVAYARGDGPGFARVLADQTDPGRRFQAHVTAGKLAEARDALKEHAEASASDHLVLYIAADGSGAIDAAAVLKQAVEVLAKGDKEARQLGRWLSRQETPVASEAVKIAIVPDSKRVALVALGVAYPSDRATYFQAAKVHNYSRTFPWLTLEKVLAGR